MNLRWQAVPSNMSKAFTKETDDADEDDPQLPALPTGGKNYITPAGYARLRAELLELIDNERPKVVEVVHWAAQQRRPLGKRRLHLRQEAPARDRPAHPLSDQAAGDRRGDRSVRAPRQRADLLWRHRDLRRPCGRRAYGDHPGHRRGRQRALASELGVADRANAAQGAHRRHAATGDAVGAGRDRSSRRPVSGPAARLACVLLARCAFNTDRNSSQIAQRRLQMLDGRAPQSQSADRWRPARRRRPCRCA